MKLRTDDDVFRIDSMYLGPPGKRIPWDWRYIDYSVFFVVFLLLMILRNQLGIGLGFWPIIWTGIAAVVITVLLRRVIDYDHPPISVLTVAGHEVTAPRPGRPTRAASRRPSSLSIAGPPHLRRTFRSYLPHRHRDRLPQPRRHRTTVPTRPALGTTPPRRTVQIGVPS